MFKLLIRLDLTHLKQKDEYIKMNWICLDRPELT